MPVSDSGVYGIVVQIAHSIGQLVGHAGRFHKGLQHLTVVVDQLANGFGLEFSNARVLRNVIAGDGELGLVAKDVNGFNHALEAASTTSVADGMDIALQFFRMTSKHLAPSLNFSTDSFVRFHEPSFLVAVVGRNQRTDALDGGGQGGGAHVHGPKRLILPYSSLVVPAFICSNRRFG